MSGSPAAVLLVEDNSDDEELTIREFTKANLANPIEVARDGQEAIDHLFADETRPVPALILLDLDLPRVSGRAVLARIRADSRTRRIPVIVLTSSNQDRDRIESYGLDADVYLTKPIRFGELTTVVASLGMYWTITTHAGAIAR